MHAARTFFGMRAARFVDPHLEGRRSQDHVNSRGPGPSGENLLAMSVRIGRSDACDGVTAPLPMHTAFRLCP